MLHQPNMALMTAVHQSAIALVLLSRRILHCRQETHDAGVPREEGPRAQPRPLLDRHADPDFRSSSGRHHACFRAAISACEKNETPDVISFNAATSLRSYQRMVERPAAGASPRPVAGNGAISARVGPHQLQRGDQCLREEPLRRTRPAFCISRSGGTTWSWAC